MYMCVAPESTIPVLSGSKCLYVLFDTYYLIVGLQIKLALYFKLSLLGLLSTTVLAGPTCHASLNTIPFASITFVAQPILFFFPWFEETLILAVSRRTSYRCTMLAVGIIVVPCVRHASCD